MPTIRRRSYTYRTRVCWKSERRANLTSEGLPDLEVATPPEFQGHEGIWNPEALFVASVESCIMTTFLAFAKRANLDFVTYESSGEGLLELDEQKRSFVFTKVTVNPKVVVAGKNEDVARAEELFAMAEERCLVSNSIRSEVIVNPEVRVSSK